MAGTSFGASMLALPSSTGSCGFLPSCALFGACWLFMMLSGLMVLEMTIAYKGKYDYIGLIHASLGRFAANLAWVAYIFLLYALITAYVSAGSHTLHSSLGTAPIFGICALLLFGQILSYTPGRMDKTNHWLMLALFASLLAALGTLLFHIKPSNLQTSDWSHVWRSSSVVILAFGFHIVVPSLTGYLQLDARRMQKAIIFGSLLALIIYVLWQLGNLGAAQVDGRSYAEYSGLLRSVLQSDVFDWIMLILQISVIVTSLLGVWMSLRHFLLESFGTFCPRLGIELLGLVPPLLMSYLYPGVFELALQYAGLFGISILLGILPALMVAKKRRQEEAPSGYRVMGGWPVLLLTALFFVLMMVLEAIDLYTA